MSRKPLVVYTLIPPKHSASFYYRISVVIETAAKLGLPIKAIVDMNDAGTSTQDRIRAFCEADLIQLYQPIGPGPVQNMRSVQAFIPSKRKNGDGVEHWKWPPTIVVDTDDNLFNVSPLNQAFKSLGIRDMNGNLIPIGHHIGVMRDGEKKVLYRDGENGFSLARNRQTIASWRRILEMADQVQCSTPNVEAAVRREVQPRRTRVFPNLVRLDHYPQVALAQEPDRLKILWQGGIAHYEDWFPLKEALGRVTERYPHVHWIIWGAQYPWVNEVIPPHRYTFVDWCPYQEYKLRLVTMDHDISLAPLTPNVFNDCRSGIKFYEASVLKKPAATVAQRTAAYADEIVDGQTGLLYDDPEGFERSLCALIEDATLRRAIAANAKDWVCENRDAMKRVPAIIESWEQLREARKVEQPHPTDAEWEKIVAQDEAEHRAELEAQGVTSDGPVPALHEDG